MILEAYGHKFEAVNEEKMERAISGTLSRNAQRVGGVGDEAEDSAKLAEYDRLGGLVKLGGDKVKRGCFWDFKGKKAVKTPVVLLSFNINGKNVDVPADEPLPSEVRAAKAAEQGETGAVDLQSLTLPKLKAYAKGKGIDLGDASSKADVLDAIQAAEGSTGE